MINPRFCARFAFICSVIWLASCSASGPATTYYVLDSTPAQNSSENADLPSIGVGPVKLPGYLENTAIISRKSGQVLNVSGAHAWAEALDQSVARLMAKTLSSELNHDNVWSFPWDLRNRPESQIHVTIEQLDGERGESIKLRAKWFVFDVNANAVSSQGSFDTSIPLSSTSYSDYAAGMSKAVTAFAEHIAQSF